MDASMAASEKEEKERTGSPNSTSTSSSKVNESPNILIKTMEAADEATLCPDRYSGNGDVCSIPRFIYEFAVVFLDHYRNLTAQSQWIGVILVVSFFYLNYINSAYI
jgi:hypothetical protein